MSSAFSASFISEMKTHWLSSSPFHQCVWILNTRTIQSLFPVGNSLATTYPDLPSPVAEYSMPSQTTGCTGLGATRFADEFNAVDITIRKTSEKRRLIFRFCPTREDRACRGALRRPRCLDRLTGLR